MLRAALRLTLAEVCVQGVSTRKKAKLLDEELDHWRQRELGSYPYLYLDARYEKVRHGGSVVD